MTIHYMTTLFAWNARIAPVFGFPLNVLLFWLIWTKTPKEMRVHSRILLQTCVVDFILLFLMLIASPMSLALFRDTQMFLLLLGYTLVAVFLFDLFGISVQFLYRYLVLNRGIKFTIARYLLLLSFPLGASKILSTMFCIIDTEATIELDENLHELLNNYLDLNASIYIALITNEFNMIFYLTMYTLSMVICYSVNIFCGIKMVAFIKSHADFNPRMKELNRQLTKNLILLAIFPLAYCCWSLLCILLYYLAKPDLTVQVEFFYTMMSPWITSVNPIVSIWVNRPYRDAIIKFINNSIQKLIKTPVNTIHPNPPIAQ